MEDLLVSVLVRALIKPHRGIALLNVNVNQGLEDKAHHSKYNNETSLILF